MWTVSFLVLVLVVGMESLDCPIGQQPCGSIGCFDPTIQGCTNDSITIQCINSCNGACFSNSQYCYNNTLICNNGQSICDYKNYNTLVVAPLGLTCYDPSRYSCYNDTLCDNIFSCGTQCITDPNSACSNNQTICYGFDLAYYLAPDRTSPIGLCGPQQQCYDNTQNICLNGTTVCPGLNAQLCGTNCFNPDIEVCTSGTIQCLNACNGACFSNSQYCYNNTLICNNGQSICDYKNYNTLVVAPLGLTCYDPSRYSCYNDTLCDNIFSCGTQCITDPNSACSNNQTICYGFDLAYYLAPDRTSPIGLCGPQQQCYDNRISICLDNNGTVCPIGNQLCSNVCYDPQLQYCIGGNNTIYCLNNPSQPNCLITSTEQISPTSSAISTKQTSPTSSSTTTTIATMAASGCCAVQSCTQNSDCCEPAPSECQCYRHIQTDVYGTCVNPYTTPICGDSCPVQGKCIFDSNCCKCQCANVSFTDQDGNLITKKQCVRR